MKRSVLFVCLMALIAHAPASAADLTDRWGLGGQLGMYKLIGGDVDYSNVDQNFGLWIRHGLSPRWSLDASIKYGYTRPGSLRGEDAGLTFDSVHAFYTTALHGQLGARYHFAPESRLAPYLSVHGGYIDWRVRDENGNADVGMFPDGEVLVGYDDEGRRHPLHGQNVTASLGLGFEWFVSESFTFDLSARYTRLFANDLDNVGSGNLWGPDHADVNNGIVEGLLGFTFHFGGNPDKDKDGILNKQDACPEVAEDFDGYQDEDGCPDADNDGDGLADADDNCPDDAEDFDGFRDEDGCPDPDNDGDGVIDAQDGCPDQAEDLDGFQDEDGCPDPDNDGDGVADDVDQCPDTPAGVEVGTDGCPSVAEIKADMVLTGVAFRSGSADLLSSSAAQLDDVAASLLAYPTATVEIQGHTDSSGSAELNRNLSMLRAEAVRNYLIGKGVDGGRLTAVGYGEDLPVADNSTREGRAANRRVELVRTDR
jgi:outer membrane protein OmpA-like peptidoglycan-associated protein